MFVIFYARHTMLLQITGRDVWITTSSTPWLLLPSTAKPVV